jgi:hypothetical protein
MEGRGWEFSSVRSDQQRAARDPIIDGGLSRTGGYRDNGASARSDEGDWGSSALGLSELDYFGYQAEELGGCAYSRSISTGRAVSRERAWRKKQRLAAARRTIN